MDAVTPPKIHGPGTPEGAWRRSTWLGALPLRDPGGLLGGQERVVVVSPHPDDEVLGCGALLFHAHELGLEVLVISVTDGEACYPDHPIWTPDRLRTVRRRELAAAIHELGLDGRCIETIGIPDGQVAEHQQALCARLAALLQPGDRVFVTWRGDGHPDHEATGRAAHEAAALRGATVLEFPIWAWHWLPSQTVGSPLPAARRYRVSGEALKAKQRAIGQFVSQLGGPGSGIGQPILPPHVLARFQRRYEVLLHGND